MELQTVVYLLIALILIYLMMCSNQYENFSQKECSENDINNQFYHYNVNTINRSPRPY